MGLLAIVSLVLMFVVLYTRYRSATLSALIMANIPLALVGAVLGLWVSGQPLSVAALIGFITLAGISVRNGILKVSHHLNLMRVEGERFDTAMIVRGSLERLSPVLMTAPGHGVCPGPAAAGGRTPRHRNPAPGGGGHLQRPHQFHAARYLPHPWPCSGCLAARMPNACWTTRTPKRSEICFFHPPLERTLMKTTRQLFAALALAALATTAAHAAGDHGAGHDHQPQHGGIVAEANDMDYELVAKPDTLTLYLRDHGKPAKTEGVAPSSPCSTAPKIRGCAGARRRGQARSKGRLQGGCWHQGGGTGDVAGQEDRECGLR